MKKHSIYLDCAATTPLDKRVFRVMLPYFKEKFGNPSSKHQKGKEALIALDNSRETIAKILNCKSDEIVFTSGGTESNNLAILGFARKNKNKGNHLITTKIEHASALEPFERLEKEGFKVTYLDVDNEGFIDISELENEISSSTILVSIIYANNEIGTIQNISAIGKICQKRKVAFHTDACQAAGSLDLNTQKLNVDLMTLNGSKIYGPKGVGVLFKKRNISLEPLTYGGNQENFLRSGTENLPSIVGMAEALKIANKEKIKNSKKIATTRDFLLNRLLKNPKISLNGPNPLIKPKKRLPNNINVKFEDINASTILLQLDEKGIFISEGSACNAGKSEPSHVLKALALSEKQIDQSLRITISKDTSKKDIEYVIETLLALI